MNEDSRPSVSPDSPVHILRTFVIIEEMHEVAGRRLERTVRRAAACAIIRNPYAGIFSPELNELVLVGEELGSILSLRLVEVFSGAEYLESLGKSAMVGMDGEIEHAAAILHPRFGHSVRGVIGGAKAMLPSSKKMAIPGTTIDVPLHYRNAALVRSHFDAMEVRIADAPRNDEIVVCLAASDHGRPIPRVGGLSISEATGSDGLR